MIRKPGFPVANCSIKMPDNSSVTEGQMCEEDGEHQQRRLQLINFGHSQWGFNNWSWSVTKQELDFVDLTNGKYCAGVVAFVSVTVKNLDIHRENIGYATSIATTKGFAIYKSRKCAVTNALRETLLSFGGTVATELTELLETQRPDAVEPESNQTVANKPPEVKNIANNIVKKEDPATNMRAHAAPPSVKNAPPVVPGPPVAPPTAVAAPPPAVAAPPPTVAAPPPAVGAPPAPLPPAANRPGPRPAAASIPAPHLRPNSNEVRLENMTEEEARAERKRRQRLAQEEFRLKQLQKQHIEEKSSTDISKNSTSLDRLLLDIPTQEIEIEVSSSGDKRKSPAADCGSGSLAKRRHSFTKLDIVTTD